MSDATIATGPLAALNGVGPLNAGVAAPAVVVLSRIVLPPAPFVPRLALATSGVPSALKSAPVSELGPLPAEKEVGPVNTGVAAPGAVVLSRTELPPAPFVS